MITLAIAALATATATPPRVQADQPAPAAAAQTQTRYCVESTRTGSRMSKKECRTRSEWLDRGFDPLAKED